MEILWVKWSSGLPKIQPLVTVDLNTLFIYAFIHLCGAWATPQPTFILKLGYTGPAGLAFGCPRPVLYRPTVAPTYTLRGKGPTGMAGMQGPEVSDLCPRGGRGALWRWPVGCWAQGSINRGPEDPEGHTTVQLGCSVKWWREMR